MDHRALIASLTAEQREALTTKSDRQGLLHLAIHWGAIAVTGALIALRAPLWPALMLVQGILLVFLFTLLHETSHLTPFRTEWLNKAVGSVCGFVIFLPAVWFRYFHLAHHRYTQVPGKDPELDTPKPETWPAYLIHVTGIPAWIGHIRTLLGNARGNAAAGYVPQSKRLAVRNEARVMIGLYLALFAVCLAARSTVLLYVWLIPLVLGQPFLRLYLLAEHGRCPFVANMLENSRTTLSNSAVRLLDWNMPYHAEHHSHPTVPFYRLPMLHTLAASYLRETESGYLAFNRKYVSSLNEKAQR